MKQHETLESRDSHTSLLPTCTRTTARRELLHAFAKEIGGMHRDMTHGKYAHIISYLVCVCVSDTPACWTKTKWGFSGASNNLPNYIELSLHDEKRQSCSEVALEGIFAGVRVFNRKATATGVWLKFESNEQACSNSECRCVWHDVRHMFFSLIGIPYLPNWINSIVCQVGHQVIKYVTNTLNATLEKISWLYTSKIDVGRRSSHTFDT